MEGVGRREEGSAQQKRGFIDDVSRAVSLTCRQNRFFSLC